MTFVEILLLKSPIFSDNPYFSNMVSTNLSLLFVSGQSQAWIPHFGHVPFLFNLGRFRYPLFQQKREEHIYYGYIYGLFPPFWTTCYSLIALFHILLVNFHFFAMSLLSMYVEKRSYFVYISCNLAEGLTCHFVQLRFELTSRLRMRLEFRTSSYQSSVSWSAIRNHNVPCTVRIPKKQIT